MTNVWANSDSYKESVEKRRLTHGLWILGFFFADCGNIYKNLLQKKINKEETKFFFGGGLCLT